MPVHMIYAHLKQLGKIERFNMSKSPAWHALFRARYTIFAMTIESKMSIGEFHRECKRQLKGWATIQSIKPLTEQSDEPLQDNPTQATQVNKIPTNQILNALNDDCLLSIFKASSINAWDLVSIANVCQRFNCIVQQVFPHKYDSKRVTWHNARKTIFWQQDIVFSTIGEWITACDLTHSTKAETDILLATISDQCPNITRFGCSVWNNDDAGRLVEIHKIMPNLTEMWLTCSSRKMRQLTYPHTAFPLTRLRLIHSSSVPLPNVTYPHLIDFEIENKRNLGANIPDCTFFQLNPQLQRIWVFFMDFESTEIFRYMPNVKELELHCGGSLRARDYMNFAQLTQLQSISISTMHADHENDRSFRAILTVLQECQVKLQRITLNGIIYMSSVVDLICRMQSITHVQIETYRYCNGGMLAHVLYTGLPNLQFLHCTHDDRDGDGRETRTLIHWVRNERVGGNRVLAMGTVVRV